MYKYFLFCVLILLYDKLLTIFVPSLAGPLRFVNVFFLILLFFVYNSQKKERNNNNREPLYLFYICLFLFIIYGLYDLIVNKTPSLLIVYAFPFYIGLFPLALYLMEANDNKFEYIIRYLLMLVIILSILTFIDYLIDLNSIFLKFGFDSSEDFEVLDPTEGEGEFARRVVGLMRPTTAYPYVLIGFVSAYVSYKYYDLSKKTFFIVATVLFLSIIPSNSRAPQFLSLLTYLMMLRSTNFIYFSVKGIFRIIVVFTILGFIGFSIFNLRDIVSHLFTITDFNNDMGNLTRVYQWLRGADLFTNLSNYTGHGLSTSSDSMRVLYGYESGVYHFESTFFLTFYESGIIGLVIRFLPFIFLIKGTKDSFIKWVAILLLINFCVVPLGSVYIGNTALFILLGIKYRFNDNLSVFEESEMTVSKSIV